MARHPPRKAAAPRANSSPRQDETIDRRPGTTEPRSITWPLLVGGAVLTGIGFTMSYLQQVRQNEDDYSIDRSLRLFFFPRSEPKRVTRGSLWRLVTLCTATGSMMAVFSGPRWASG